MQLYGIDDVDLLTGCVCSNGFFWVHDWVSLLVLVHLDIISILDSDNPCASSNWSCFGQGLLEDPFRWEVVKYSSSATVVH